MRSVDVTAMKHTDTESISAVGHACMWGGDGEEVDHTAFKTRGDELREHLGEHLREHLGEHLTEYIGEQTQLGGTQP